MAGGVWFASWLWHGEREVQGGDGDGAAASLSSSATEGSSTRAEMELGGVVGGGRCGQIHLPATGSSGPREGRGGEAAPLHWISRQGCVGDGGGRRTRATVAVGGQLEASAASGRPVRHGGSSWPEADADSGNRSGASPCQRNAERRPKACV